MPFSSCAAKAPRAITATFVALLTLLLIVTVQADDSNTMLAGPKVDVEPLEGEYTAAILVDAQSGLVLGEKNADEQRQPASMLKMMTELIILERIDEGDLALTDTVTVSARASRMGGSQVYLKHREIFTVEELLSALAIHSANDAAVALAEHTAGSVEAFVDLMNERARRLNMTGTEYHSVHGLPAGRREEPDMTTARDLAKLGRELLRHPRALAWSSQATAPFRGGKFTLYNPNKLVGTFRGLDGLKTGYHGRAGYCVTATAVQKNVRLLSVVLGCKTDLARATETTRLLAYGFNQYHQLTLIEAAGADAVITIPVVGGKTTEVSLVYGSELTVSVPRDRSPDVLWYREVPDQVEAPVAEGDRLGVAVATLDGHELGRVELLASATVEKGNWFHRLIH